MPAIKIRRAPVTTRTVAAYLKNRSGRIYVAEEMPGRSPSRRQPDANGAGGILGMASVSLRPSLFHAGTSCVIEELVVGGGHRGRGIGGRLVSRAVQEAKRAGCAEISVSTEKTNGRAIALYKSRGLKDEFLYLEKHF
jgi:ribosomal protein S18 acetylase RimI-like enzyme